MEAQENRETMAAVAYASTSEGVLAEQNGALSVVDRQRIRKAMNKGVDFSLDGVDEYDGFEGSVVTLRPMTHPWSEDARKAAQDLYGEKLWGKKYRSSKTTVIWPALANAMIRARFIMSTVMAWRGPPLVVAAGQVDLSDLKGAQLRARLMEIFCPDLPYGEGWTEDQIQAAFDDSGFDIGFVEMLESCHNVWRECVDAKRFLLAVGGDPTSAPFVARPGDIS